MKPLMRPVDCWSPVSARVLAAVSIVTLAVVGAAVLPPLTLRVRLALVHAHRNWGGGWAGGALA